MIVTTGNEIQGRRISAYLGVVRGIVVRAPGIGRSFMGSLAAIGGGNIREFEEVCEEARGEAYGRMIDHARDKEADAVVAMRYDATEFMQGATEVLAYGTAVKLEPLEPLVVAEAPTVEAAPGPGEPANPGETPPAPLGG
jgi:uncharacterized protein YbjQ (UPF0145 family)